MSRKGKGASPRAEPAAPAAWNPLWSVLFAAWAALVLWGYAGPGRVPYLRSLSMLIEFFPPLWQMTWTSFARHCGHLWKLALFIAIAWSVGRALIVRVFRVSGLNPLESASFGVLLGVGCAGYAAFALGVLGLLRPPVMATVAFAAAGASVYYNRDLLLERPDLGFMTPARLGLEGWAIPAALILALVLFLQGFYALAPETFADSLVYHLAIPQTFLQEGKLVATPFNMYSGVPMQFQMGYLWALAFDDEILAKLLHCAMGVALALGMVALGVRRGCPSSGWFASGAFLAAPLVCDNAMRSGVEVAAAAWTFASLHAAMIFMDQREETSSAPASLLLSGVFAGLAAATKYNYWCVPVLLAACLAGFRNGRGNLARFCAASALCVLPWIVKNTVFFGNPVFPWLDPVFNPEAQYPVHWARLHADAWGRNWPQILASGQALAKTLLHPWFITVEGFSDFDYVGPIFLLLLPLVLRRQDSADSSRLLRWGALGLWLAWWPFSGMPRFFLPGLAALIVIQAGALPGFAPVAARHALLALLFLLMVNDAAVFAHFASRFQSWGYLLHGMPKSEYLANERLTYPAPYHAAAEWINENTPPKARVLVVGDGRSFFLKRRAVASSPLDEPVFFHLLSRARTAREFLSSLQSYGITHLLVNMALLSRNKPPPDPTGSQAAVLDEFLARHAEPVFEDRVPAGGRWSFVYELRAERVAAGPASILSYWFRHRR